MKLKVLIYDVGGCEGCPTSILRELNRLANLADVYSQHLGNLDLDMKFDIAVITGAVCINASEKLEVLRKIRENSTILIAYGSCASVGGITLLSRGGQDPKPEHRTFLPVSSNIQVDYAIPGCPPAPSTLISLLIGLRTGKSPFLKIFAAIAKVKKLSGFDLMDEVVLRGLCIGCGACILSCPTHALQMIEKHSDLIVEKCIRCGTCCSRCPVFTKILVLQQKPNIKLIGGATE